MRTISTPEASRSAAAVKVASGPRGVPILGCLPDIRRDRLGFLMRVALAYPDIAHYRIANLSMYQLTQPTAIEHVLQTNQRNYVKGPIFDNLRGVLGNGLFLSEGDFWLRQRRLMQPTFHRHAVAGFADLIVRETEAMLASWRSAASEGRPVDVAQALTRLTMAVVTQALFGTRVADDTQAIGRAITTVLADFIFRFDRPLYPPVAVPTPHNRQAAAALRMLDETVFRIIGGRRREGEAAPQGDFLAMLMAARDEETGEGMNDKQLRDEVLTFFLAGHETTATALAWTFYLVSTHPEVARRLEAELADVLCGRAPAASDLPSLRYTRMVIDEAIRLYPPAWLTNRMALQDDEILGYRIPARSYVLISPYVLHRHPAYWDNPEAFDPDRFSADYAAGRPRYAYFPFGGGPRMCIGQGFALTEAQLVLATVAQRYRLHLLPGHAVLPEPQVTLRPRGGLPMLLKGR